MVPLTLINVLNDDETFTNAHGCQVLAVDDSIEDLEQALTDEDYSYVVGYTVNDGILVIHIYDNSGVTVVINDERRL